MAPRASGPFQSSLGKYTLSRNISAIQITPAVDGRAQLGMLTQLPEGAQVDLCGDGFNDRTVKVRSGQSYYFVFLEDLESGYPAEPAHAFAHA